MRDTIEDQQEALCRKYDAGFREAGLNKIVGVADNVNGKELPINGLRHSTTETTTGWYIWAGGEPSSHPNFFKSMHINHLLEIRPEVTKYLGLPPGWRFLIDPAANHEDVWRDDSLLLNEG